MDNIKQNDFYWSGSQEPHIKRRMELKKKYPEIKELLGYDHVLAVTTVLLVIIQLASAYFIPKVHIILYILYAYFIGATITHALFLAVHEITHYLAFKNKTGNMILALIANLPIVFPYAMAFQKYHALHHWEQGTKVDTDIPSEMEAKVFKGTIGKLVWAFNQILFYAIRPMMVYPIKPTSWIIFNIIFQLAAMVGFYFIVGWEGLLYLLICDFIGGSLHPTAGHFISEHYVFKPGQETYSYYGPLNKVTFNVGYHNEHHDFPAIPGSRLYKLKEIAPEYYDTLYSHKSWVKVIWDFITMPEITLYSRTKRN